MEADNIIADAKDLINICDLLKDYPPDTKV
jgi:hypothetical protein